MGQQSLLLDPDLHFITEAALRNFDTDVRFLEDFVRRQGDPTVQDTFVELRQVSMGNPCRDLLTHSAYPAPGPCHEREPRRISLSAGEDTEIQPSAQSRCSKPAGKVSVASPT